MALVHAFTIIINSIRMNLETKQDTHREYYCDGDGLNACLV